jgi:uncharacterized protein (TIGR03435 family)
VYPFPSKRLKKELTRRTRQTALIGAIVLALALLARGSATEVQAQATNRSGNDAPRFEVASVKKVDLPVITPGAGGQIYQIGLQMNRAGTVKCSYCSLSSMIEMAWDVKPYQVAGPTWIELDKFVIDARMPAGTPTSSALLMLQTLLLDRFQLQLSVEDRVSKVYALKVSAKGAKLEATEEPATSVSAGAYSIGAPGMPLADLALRLSRRLDLPVVDKTGLPGRFKIELEWQPDGPDGSEKDSLFRVLRENLGLELRPDTANIKMIVVQKALRTPTEN